ncbi:unnamed protein product, partial [Didymodactylos carnosus]
MHTVPQECDHPR